MIVGGLAERAAYATHTGAMVSPVGRFAPSPTGELHLGNLRTAVIAWLSARSRGRGFIVRMEDLDRVTSSRRHEAEQLRDLAAIGIEWDGEVVRQSDRFPMYDAAIQQLTDLGRTYECFCTRREIRDAISAPQQDAPLLADGAYPGTCRRLRATEIASLRAGGRRPAIRLRADDVVVRVIDELRGEVEGVVDDVVLRRNDGVPAYNLAVVVDDASQGVGEVVRAADLLSSTPRQVLLQRLLGLPTPTYMHVPLVLGSNGVRLAKRHGAVTLGQLAERGIEPASALNLIAVSVGLVAPDEEGVSIAQLIERFDRASIAREPWVLPVDLQRSHS